VLAVLSCALVSCHAQPAETAAKHPRAAINRPQTPEEARTARAFDAARARGPLDLYAFLHDMPKGGDLHNHLSGAVYAESWIRAAAQDHLCVDIDQHAFVKPKPASPTAQQVHCDAKAAPAGEFPASDLADNQPLYDALVDAFSMRAFVPVSGESGHDHFFNTFDKFDGTSPTHLPEYLDEVATRAARQNEQYLELMHTPPFVEAARLAVSTGYTGDFAADRGKMIDAGLRTQIAPISDRMTAYLNSQRELEHCGTPAATPACGISIRFIYQVLRNFPPPVVFAQILLGFEVAAAHPEQFVAINLVQPEDDFYAMRDYRLHMRMIAALHRFYPGVHITLHAGELAPGLVPPEGLTFHIRDAIETAGAERIGHGVDVMYEDHPDDLLRSMATRHTMVEINLTSNQGILNIGGKDHPLPVYLAAGVPVALSTDDEGVNRSDMTHEYLKAATTYNLTYSQLKDMARNSLTYSFLPGDSLWPIASAAEMYRAATPACRASLAALPRTPGAPPAAPCAAFLATSQKAGQQWQQERRFAAFESTTVH